MKNLTSGSIVQALARLAVPIVITNLLHSAYQLTDTFWVGRLGAEAVAAAARGTARVPQAEVAPFQDLVIEFDGVQAVMAA